MDVELLEEKLPRYTLLTLPMVAWAVAIMEETGDKLKTLFSLFQARVEGGTHSPFSYWTS